MSGGTTGHARVRLDALDVDHGFEVAVGIQQVDEVVVRGRRGGGGGGVGAFQRPEDLPQILTVAERRIDSDRGAHHRRGDEYLDVGAPHPLAVNPALFDVVRLRDGVVLASFFTAKLVDNQLPHLNVQDGRENVNAASE